VYVCKLGEEMAITAWKETHKFYLALLNIFAEKLPPEK
jgi:hypothetical protein